MHTVISVVGPTATGKTAFALSLKKILQQDIDLISADSRQVYKGMEIGTGVDLNPDKLPSGVRVHGSSFLLPTEEWSVAHFRLFARESVLRSWQQNALPVIVGGTGLYHRYLFSSDPEIDIAPNNELRERAQRMPLSELQAWAKEKNAVQFAEMNGSDRANPRRLIRLIERANTEVLPNESDLLPADIQHLTIGLIDSLDHISERIAERIQERLRSGFLAEVQELMARYSDEEWKLPAFSATGFKEARAFIEEKISQDELETLWLRREVQYAKRQITWWKTARDVEWFDISQTEWQKDAEKRIIEYTNTYEKNLR